MKLTFTKAEQVRLKARISVAREKALAVCRLLKDLDAEEVYIFGSLVKGTFGLHSDVDFAVAGLPDRHVYRVESRLEDIMGKIDYNLVYLESALETLRERITKEGYLWNQPFLYI